VRFVLHPDAVAEATAAGDWYDAQRPGLGTDFASELERAFELILENPQTWPMWPGTPAELSVRRFLLPSSRLRWRTSREARRSLSSQSLIRAVGRATGLAG